MHIFNPLNWTWYVADLTGLAGIALVIAFTIACYLRHPQLGTILALAALARVSAGLFHYYVMMLPDAGYDALGFEIQAWKWSGRGLAEAFGHFGERGGSWIYSNVGSLLYVAIGRSPLFFQSLSMIAGITTVVLTYKLALEMWQDERFARKATWLVALFPTLILYSSVTMREPYIVLLFVGAIWFVVRWARTGLYRYLAFAFLLFGLQVFFHAGMVLGAIALGGYVAWELTRDLFVRFFDKGYIRIIPAIVIATATVILSAYWYTFVGLSIPYVGRLAGLFDVAIILRQASNVAIEAGSAWPSFLLPSSLLGVILVTPLRTLYFLFSPFPWDLRAVNHVIGLLDAVLYMVIIAAAWRNRAAIAADRAARVIVLIVLPLILAFAWGTGNSGTAVRHRSKLVIGFILLAGAYLPRIKYGSR